MVLKNKDFLKGNVNTSYIEESGILKTLKNVKPSKKKLSNDKKILIVTTAVSQYMKRKQNGYSNGKPNPWVMAARQDSMNNKDEAF